MSENTKFIWGKEFARRVAHLCVQGRVCWLQDEVPCPFVDTFCHDVTSEDWVHVMKHVFKDYPV